MLVKEIFGPTIQGEGSQAGMTSIFIRFSGCNMWSGKAEHREKSMCPFCDTDFETGREMTALEIYMSIIDIINTSGIKNPLIVFTGGEPLLQPHIELSELIDICQYKHWWTQLETNGSIDSKELAFNYITCSPKQPADKLKIHPDAVQCLKLLHPHPNKDITPESMEEYFSEHVERYLQPIDTGDEKKNVHNIAITLEKLYQLSDWKLSLQTHKMIGVK